MLYLSRRSKASGRLKSGCRARRFLASSSSFSREICSLKALTSSLSSLTLIGEYLLDGLLVAAGLKPEPEAAKLLAGEPLVAAKPAPRVELEAPRVAPAPSALSGEVAVLLKGDDGLFDSSKAAEEVVAAGRGLGIAGLTASANSSSMTLLSPSASSLLMIAITSPSVATNPFNLRKVWMFLWLRV